MLERQVTSGDILAPYLHVMRGPIASPACTFRLKVWEQAAYFQFCQLDGVGVDACPLLSCHLTGRKRVKKMYIYYN